jgi:hypothetical protein
MRKGKTYLEEQKFTYITNVIQRCQFLITCKHALKSHASFNALWQVTSRVIHDGTQEMWLTGQSLCAKSKHILSKMMRCVFGNTNISLPERNSTWMDKTKDEVVTQELDSAKEATHGQLITTEDCKF